MNKDNKQQLMDCRKEFEEWYKENYDDVYNEAHGCVSWEAWQAARANPLPDVTKWESMNTAPKDGTEFIGKYGKNESLVRWAEKRTCMLSGIGGGNGYFGAGWECCENKLIIDEPEAWKPYIYQPPAPLPAIEKKEQNFEEIFSLLQIRCKEFNFEQGVAVGEIHWRAIIINNIREPILYFGNCKTYENGKDDWYALTNQLKDFYNNPNKYMR